MTLEYEVQDSIGIVTLNRPEVLNAFNDEMGKATLRAVAKAAEDEAVRCIVLTGAGRAFSSGEDLGALAGQYERGEAPNLGRTLTDRYNPLIHEIRAAPKPVVAALNGVAAGAGAGIALACDFRVASDKAKLILAFIKVGLVPDSGSVWFLTKMIGAARAWELAATGRPVDMDEAAALGLVNHVWGADDFDTGWRSFASDLAQGPTRAFALTKQLVNDATQRDLGEQLDIEVDAQSAAGRTKDHIEGVQAFLAKRPPKFQGR